jgi:hypothetical protein
LEPNEQRIITTLRAPESIWFYKIYGLAHLWWLRFLYPESSFKEKNDVRASGKEANDWKENNDFRAFGKEANDWKENNDFRASGSGFKEIVDNPGGQQVKETLDAYSKQTAIPAFLNNLLARVKELEARLRVKKSPFIKPFQRPTVGRATIRSKRK